jgi:hypothetical protein
LCAANILPNQHPLASRRPSAYTAGLCLNRVFGVIWGDSQQGQQDGLF